MVRLPPTLSLAAVLACGGSQSTEASDASSADAKAGCLMTLAKFCAWQQGQGGSLPIRCDATLSRTISDPAFCGLRVVISTSVSSCCTGTTCPAGAPSYEALEMRSADVGNTYYFEAATKALVAIAQYGDDGKLDCMGGPADFVLPQTCGQTQGVARCPGGGEAGADW